MTIKINIHLLFASLLMIGCSEQGKLTPVLRMIPSGESGVKFENSIATDELNVMQYVNLYNGSGVGIGDFDNDGFEDVFFGGNLVSSKLYLNQGSRKKLVFEDVTELAGVSTHCWINGVTVTDVNQDGRPDIYCSVSGGDSEADRKNLLFINRGTGPDGNVRFQEKAADYGLDIATHSIQSAFFDYDGDGDLDVFVLTNPPIGYLDSDANEIAPIPKKGDPDRYDRLYRNEGIGPEGHSTFKDVSQEAGITLEGFSLGIAVHDFNGDNRPDVYVANDYVTNDLLYINNGDGTFTDRIRDYVTHTSYSSMGIDVADINNDGLMDVAVMDMLPEKDKDVKMMYSASNHIGHGLMEKLGYVDQYNRNMLQLNNGRTAKGPKRFSEIGRFAAIQHTNWSWSVLMPDLDLDGWRDVFITNGFLKDVNDLDFINYEQANPFTKQKFDGEAYVKSLEKVKGIHLPNYVFRNKKNLQFDDVGEAWGINQNSFSNGAAYSDLDNDGDLDLVVNNINDTASIYENRSVDKPNENDHFLQIELVGNNPNRQATGATIEFGTSQGTQVYEQQTTRGYLSSVSPIANFGLGKDSIIANLKITWPDGSFQMENNIRANQRIKIKKSDQANTIQESESPSSLSFNDSMSSRLENDLVETKVSGIDYQHQERPFNDFDNQPLIPFKLSRMGPGLAVGDVDNDGLDDFYVGGTNGTPGEFFLQNGKGEFKGMQIEDTIWYEDQGGLLLDLDNDNDLDAYLVSGGTERGENSRFYADRVLINTGNRKFRKSDQGFPRNNGSCAIAADYNKDGLLDIFVGGASVPDAYPLTAQSGLLKNATENTDNPKLMDDTPDALKNIGIVRSAVWSDYDNDTWPDLLIVGDFMPLTIFRNHQGRLVKVDASELPTEKGLWKNITSVDVDRDGDMDYILGNNGLNSNWRPSKKSPITMYVADFDKNGTIDPVVTARTNNRESPVHLRNDLFKQLISLKKDIPDYKQYAEAEISNIFTEEELKKAKKLSFDFAESICLRNDGKDGFTSIPLPDLAQISPIYGIQIDDFNNDGTPDLIAIGNSKSTDVFNGFEEASVGLILIGKGNGTFDPVPPKNTSFYVTGEAKAISKIKIANGTFLDLISRTNDSVSVFKRTKQNIFGSIDLKPFDEKIIIEYKDGKAEMREGFYGSGYYSQSTRSIELNKNMETITITNNQGTSRTVEPKGQSIKLPAPTKNTFKIKLK